jgi:predicted secreted Zn-dependent protease
VDPIAPVVEAGMNHLRDAAPRWVLRCLLLVSAPWVGAALSPPGYASLPAVIHEFRAPERTSPESPLIRISEEFYEIRGSTAEELHGEMQRLGPLGEEGRRFHGWTAWTINWRYVSQPSGSACRATRVEVTAEITLTLPRWRAPPDAPESLRRQWDAYLAALRVHEDGHRDLAVATARRVHSRLSGFRTSDCRDFNREANTEGQRILDRLRADNRRYDEETGHGRTQGAVWPPLG